MQRFFRIAGIAITAAAGSTLAASYLACIAAACSNSRFDQLLLGVLAAAAAVVTVSALLRHRFAAIILSAIIPCFAALYLFEAIIPAPQKLKLQSLLDAVRRYQDQGQDATVASRGQVRLSDGSDVITVSGPSSRRVVMCQEGARPVASYRADDMGFNNPAEVWTQAAQIVFVGDSYTHGACVEDASHFVRPVRQKFAGTINLGFSGNGPLVELAAIREYARELRPRYVFWMYTEENDVLTYSPPSDLDNELGQPILARYLNDPAFTQNLLPRQRLVNDATNRAADAWTAQAGEQIVWTQRLQHYLTLPAAREVLRSAYVRAQLFFPVSVGVPTPVPAERIAQFTSILQIADNEVRAWGGRLVFVNLPTHRLACLGRDHPSRQVILDIPRRLGLDLIDLEGPLFDVARAQGTRVISGDGVCGGHYSELGYAVVAKVLLEYLGMAEGELELQPSWNETRRNDGSRQLNYFGHAHVRSRPLRP